MDKAIKIKQGLDIKLKGKAEKVIQPVTPKQVAIQPTDFVGLTPRLLVKEGDEVQVGTPLFCDKRDERILFVSPVNGTVCEIRRGAKRLLEAVVIQNAMKTEDHETTEQHGAEEAPRWNCQNAEELKKALLETGLWPMIRQRPYSTVANPDDQPKAFFVSAFDTAPLAPDMDYVVEHFPNSFEKGLEVLSLLSGGKLHLCVHEEKTRSALLLKAKNGSLHRFSGPHPAGNVGTQINKLCPINKGDIVWYCGLQEVINIGHYFLTGQLDFNRIYALAGTGLAHPRYCRTILGTAIGEILHGDVKEGRQRIVSGHVLTGKAVTINDFVGFYHNMVTVIPEGDNRHELLGWIWPGFKKYSVSRTFPSAFVPNELRPEVELDTNTHGEERPFVVTGEFEKVFPFDIHPLSLIKACIIGDIDLMEQLGIYEVDPEDFALCEFIDPSKNDIQRIIREGLDKLMAEQR